MYPRIPWLAQNYELRIQKTTTQNIENVIEKTYKMLKPKKELEWYLKVSKKPKSTFDNIRTYFFSSFCVKIFKLLIFEWSLQMCKFLTPYLINSYFWSWILPYCSNDLYLNLLRLHISSVSFPLCLNSNERLQYI